MADRSDARPEDLPDPARFNGWLLFGREWVPVCAADTPAECNRRLHELWAQRPGARGCKTMRGASHPTDPFAPPLFEPVKVTTIFTGGPNERN